jgi:hypothetical protein
VEDDMSARKIIGVNALRGIELPPDATPLDIANALDAIRDFLTEVAIDALAVKTFLINDQRAILLFNSAAVLSDAVRELGKPSNVIPAMKVN